MDGTQIVCIRVPQADWRAKPIYLNGNVYKGTYRRNNEGDYHCTEAQVKAMIRDSNADGNDGILIEYYGKNNLYQFFRIVSSKVLFDLPRPFKLEKGGKRNDDTPQHEAVREAEVACRDHLSRLKLQSSQSKNSEYAPYDWLW
jgi:hypothetical protein